VNGRARNALVLELLAEALGAMLGAREDECACVIVALEQTHEQVGFLGAAHRIEALLDAIDRRAGRRNLDAYGLVERRLDDLEHLP